MTKLAVLDFEGTSRVASSRATEIGIVQLSDDYEIASEFESVIHPPVKPDKSSVSIARLSNAELEMAPSFVEIWPEIYKQLNQKVLVAHNKSYEENVLRNELLPLGIMQLPPFLCTLEWSRKILGFKVSNHSLANLCDYFNIEFTNAHEALADVRATAALLRKLIELDSSIVKEIELLGQSTLSFPNPSSNAKKLLPRQRFFTSQRDSAKIKEVIERVTKYRLKLVVVTGTPDCGKEEFGETVASVGLEYRETPPTLGTSFVVQSNNNPGMSKIRKALELGIPVLSESDALLVIEKLRK